MSGVSPSPVINSVSSRPKPAEASVKFRNDAPMTMSMIMDVILTVPRTLCRSMSKDTPPKKSAMTNAPATPTAAASVGVAHPR